MCDEMKSIDLFKYPEGKKKKQSKTARNYSLGFKASLLDNSKFGAQQCWNKCWLSAQLQTKTIPQRVFHT